MICKKCQESGYFQALSEATCIKCEDKTPTPHLPPYKVCKRCSMVKGLCEQCGEKLNM